MKSIAEVCASHRAHNYFEDSEGLIGVYNHAYIVFWYQWTLGGYSLTGSTNTPQGAQMRRLEQ